MATAMIWADQHAAAFEQAERLAVGDSAAGGPGGEDAGQDRAQRSADAVDAEGVERIVVAEPATSALVQAR